MPALAGAGTRVSGVAAVGPKLGVNSGETICVAGRAPSGPEPGLLVTAATATPALPVPGMIGDTPPTPMPRAAEAVATIGTDRGKDPAEATSAWLFFASIALIACSFCI